MSKNIFVSPTMVAVIGISLASGSSVEADVAEAVWRAATDPSTSLRIPAGEDAVAWAKAG
jgi:hypothetical protein